MRSPRCSSSRSDTAWRCDATSLGLTCNRTTVASPTRGRCCRPSWGCSYSSRSSRTTAASRVWANSTWCVPTLRLSIDSLLLFFLFSFSNFEINGTERRCIRIVRIRIESIPPTKTVREFFESRRLRVPFSHAENLLQKSYFSNWFMIFSKTNRPDSICFDSIRTKFRSIWFEKPKKKKSKFDFYILTLGAPEN